MSIQAGHNQPPVTPELVAEHGINAEEYDKLLESLGREPNLTELGIFSVMWSEHCSYKSSRVWLKQLPTEAPWVICGPGENAGVVDIGEGLAAIFKMESHNHPSFIEPYQGAATGVGGILRDVFTMGARPVANLNALRFGDPSHPKTHHLIGGVVAGIGGYGNCVGVPTVAGNAAFDAGYNGNILVNAMTVGIAEADRIFYAAAAGVGNPVIYVGAKTGRDGIHGATMASAEFDDETEEKRPTVQVGDPFTEKLLIEACLELMATDAIIGIQDMGAAGLTCSSVEMADKGGMGIEIDLDAVPARETGMTAYELMLSESQERMLMVLRPEAEAQAKAIFAKWGLDAATIGRLTDTGRLTVKHHGETFADIPVRPLVENAPIYHRPHVAPPAPAATPAAPTNVAPLDALQQLMASPDLCSRRWIWEQYDHMVMADSVSRPGGDAGVVRIHGSNRALAVTADCTARYCQAEPVTGGRQAVAEAWRNLTAVGAKPLAITDCLNFGNPERPEIMGQFVGALQGMGEACKALTFPVVSGNVSLYNETNGQAIPPTPMVGAIGLIDDLDRTATIALREDAPVLLLIGGMPGHLGASLYLRQVLGKDAGAPPQVDLDLEQKHGDFVRSLIASGRVKTCHDVSDGGLLVAIAEMALAGKLGAALDLPDDAAVLFGEDQARYVLGVSAAEADETVETAAAGGIPVARIGQAGGDALTLPGGTHISLDTLRAGHEGWLPGYMSGER